MDAFLGPVRLQQAAQHRHVEVGGVAHPLGQRGGQTGGGGRPLWNRDTDMDVGATLTFSHDRKPTTFPSVVLISGLKIKVLAAKF